MTFLVAERFFAKNNISICSEKIFYKYVSLLKTIVIEYTNKICLINFVNIKDNAILAFDASWAHKRKSYQCFGELIDTFSDKIIGWKVIQDQNTTPQSLEINVLKSMKYRYTDRRVKGHVQDGDVKSLKLIQSWKKSISLNF